jgi:hypothetical protein
VLKECNLRPFALAHPVKVDLHLLDFEHPRPWLGTQTARHFAVFDQKAHARLLDKPFSLDKVPLVFELDRAFLKLERVAWEVHRERPA